MKKILLILIVLFVGLIAFLCLCPLRTVYTHYQCEGLDREQFSDYDNLDCKTIYKSIPEKVPLLSRRRDVTIQKGLCRDCWEFKRLTEITQDPSFHKKY